MEYGAGEGALAGASPDWPQEEGRVKKRWEATTPSASSSFCKLELQP